ncbi:MAG TPA: hypothetical protein VMN36_07415 [Verrucomicrobiales bacterium]|nr:hypothetical protein [Verrucomicrobiales bacterium]
MKTRIRYGKKRKKSAPAASPVSGPRLPVRLPPKRPRNTPLSGRLPNTAATCRPGGLAEALRELKAAIDEVLPSVEDAELREPQITNLSRFR